MKEYLFFADIGNTSTSFGVFEDDVLIAKTSVLTKSELDIFKGAIEKMIQKHRLEKTWFVGGLISSVVPNVSRLVQIAIESALHFIVPVMGKRYNSLVKTNVDNKDEIGGDLLADVAFANEEGMSPCLVVDLGTITKFLLIDEKQTFIATNFFPGVRLLEEDLSTKTALLPEASLLKKPHGYLGTNTVDAMEGGLYFGNLHMIEGYINNLKKEYPNLKILLTGGYAKVFKDDLKDFIFDEDVTLKGIKSLYRLGVKHGF